MYRIGSIWCVTLLSSCGPVITAVHGVFVVVVARVPVNSYCSVTVAEHQALILVIAITGVV